MRYFFVTDFNLQQTSDICRESGYAYREIGVRSINRVSAITHIPTVRSQVTKPISVSQILTSRPIPLPCLRATDLSREPALHRNLSACSASQALSLGHPRKYRQEHTAELKQTVIVQDLVPDFLKYLLRIGKSTAQVTPINTTKHVVSYSRSICYITVLA